MQYFRSSGHFVRDFHAEGPGFKSEVMLRMNGE